MARGTMAVNGLSRYRDAVSFNIIELMSRLSSEKSAFDLGFEAGASASINLTMKDLRHVERARPLRPSGN